MDRTSLIKTMAEKAGVSQVAAAKALTGCLDAITNALESGDSVSLVGFGSFAVSARAARKGRNPQSGKEITIPAKKVVKFRVGKKLADAVK